MARYIGIDYGEKRVGVAISDPSLTIAQPLTTIRFQSKKQLIKELREIVHTHSAEKIVLGLPITMKGTDSQKTVQVRAFAEELSRAIGVPVHLMDERLTSVQAHQTMQQMGKQPSRHRARVDQLAAQYILQTFLDREKNLRNL
ncbi:MAG TPA: Holliday junction resolvase RuvX [Caldithrix sp.]|nr:Holliday junction resolvase RuvX [Caldithrix sp.]